MATLLRFSTSSELDSAAIRLHTDCPISHVEFELADGSTFGSRLSGGVKFRPVSESSQDFVIRATFDGIEAALSWGIPNRNGWEYDALGIFGLATGKDLHDRKGRFCSELIRECIDATGKSFFAERLPMWLTTPRDLLIVPEVTIVSAPAAFERL